MAKSPGYYFSERDFARRASAATTSIGAILGEAHSGPVGVPTLVTSSAEYLALFGAPDARIGYMGYAALAFLEEANQLYVVRVAPTSTYGGMTVGFDGTFTIAYPWADGVFSPDELSFEPSNLFHVYAVNQGAWNSGMSIRLYPDTKNEGSYFYLEVYREGRAQPLETWRCHLDYEIDGFGVQLNVEAQINQRSNYIRIIQNHEFAALVENPQRQLVNTFLAGNDATRMGIQLVGGSNGDRPTKYELIEALELYEDPEVIDINILINGGITDPDFQRAMDNVCQQRRDCVAILDMPQPYQATQAALHYRREVLMLDSTYSAIYSPDVLYADPLNDIRLYVPPSGHVAACYAKTDREAKTWFAPAGMDRGNLKVSGLYEIYRQGHRDALYDSQINAIRLIDSGGGIKVWGADTLQIVQSPLSNMSVRRLLLFIERAMENVLLVSVFNPNDQQLRSRLETAGNQVLQPIQDADGLYSFHVQCDDQNNTPNTIAAGDLYVDFWLDPTLPVKRVMFTAIINATGVRITANV